MWIKICANTNAADAKLAVECGANALGFVFARSSRQVTAGQAGLIVSELPGAVEKIGVFDTLDFKEIADTVRTASLTGVQIHGGFVPSLLKKLAEEFPGLRLIQTTHYDVGARVEAQQAEDDLAALRGTPEIGAVLVDSRTAAASGGSGVAFDWNAAQEGLSVLAPMPLIVAGGLHAGNVRRAIEVLRPWGVDVATGVEACPGQKDPARVKEFIDAARSAAASGQ